MSKKSHKTDRVFVFVSLGAVAAAGIVGFRLIGSPNKQRLLSLDKERVEDLLDISNRLWNDTGQGIEARLKPLPSELPSTNQNAEAYLDPKTGEPYEYRRLSDTTYELCATFALDSEDRETRRYRRNPKWEHPAGRHCYQIDVAKSQSYSPAFVD